MHNKKFHYDIFTQVYEAFLPKSPFVTHTRSSSYLADLFTPPLAIFLSLTARAYLCMCVCGGVHVPMIFVNVGEDLFVRAWV